jgi:hypothetical protein
VNDQTGIRASAYYRIENFVERNDNVIKFSEKKLKREKGAGHLAGDSNRSAPQRLASISFLIGC